MARISYYLGDIVGSIGRNTFQFNRSGSIVRARPIQRKSSKVLQQVRHAEHQLLLNQWQGLTPTEKTEWNNYADSYEKINKFGQSKILTGANWFESLNYWKNYLSQSIFTSPPAHTIPPDAPAFEIEMTELSLLLTLTDSFNWDENNLIIWASTPTLAQTTSINRIRKLLSVETEDIGEDFDITSLWESATDMQWNPLTIFPSTNIFICLQAMSKESFITSPLLCSKENTGGIIPESESSSFYYY